MSTTITIQRGDTLWALARKHGTSVSALAQLNGIRNPNLIYAGAQLKVPGHGGGSSFEPARPARPPVQGTGGSGNAGAGSGSPSGVHGSSRLAEAARAAAMGMGGYSSQGLCARGVSRAIVDAMGLKVWGNGNQIDNNLPRSRFKQIDIPLEQALKIPGLVLTWEKTSTRLGSIYGHTAITLGDGRSSASDFIERNTLAGSAGRSGLKIFMPL